MKKTKVLSIVVIFFVSLFLILPGCRTIFKDYFVFLQAYFLKPSSIGAIVPSTAFLANAVTKHIDINNQNNLESVKILEVGAGTGVMTEKILEKLRPQDILDVVELDPEFCKILKDKFKKYKNIKIYNISILDWNPNYSYNYIISGLPFNSFNHDFLKSVLNKYKTLIVPGGIISYFEYIALAKIKLFFLTGQEKTQFSQTITTTDQFVNQYEFDNEKVFANIPPAQVHHLTVS
jgi:phospholipid N-methyltransferase